MFEVQVDVLDGGRSLAAALVNLHSMAQHGMGTSRHSTGHDITLRHG
jgi:hypothetical protein